MFEPEQRVIWQRGSRPAGRIVYVNEETGMARVRLDQGSGINARLSELALEVAGG